MALIGLTGGIASGKTTAARVLEDLGAAVIDADLIGHEVLTRPDVISAVGERFGESVLASDGSIDRARLAEIVFKDPAARVDLERISHPLIFEEIRQRAGSAQLSHEVVVIEAALLVETMGRAPGPLGLDALVVVSANVEDQISRMITERSMTDESARARIAAQQVASKKLAAADYILDNRGDLEELRGGVEVLMNDISDRFVRRGD